MYPAGWQAGWLIGWLTDWLADYLIDWFSEEVINTAVVVFVFPRVLLLPAAVHTMSLVVLIWLVM